MSINPDAITETIRRAGGKPNARVTPDGDRYKIEVNEAGQWRTLQTGLSRGMAEDLISRGSNRVILG